MPVAYPARPVLVVSSGECPGVVREEALSEGGDVVSDRALLAAFFAVVILVAFLEGLTGGPTP